MGTSRFSSSVQLRMTRISGFEAVSESAILLTIRNRLPSVDKSKARQDQLRVSTYSGSVLYGEEIDA